MRAVTALLLLLTALLVAAGVLIARLCRERRRDARTMARWAVRARIGRTLAEGIGDREAIRSVIEMLVPDHADWCVLHMVDAGMVRREAVVHRDPALAQRLREVFARQPFVGTADAGPAKVIRTGQPYLIPNFTGDELAKMPDPDLIRSAGTGCCISVPLRARGDVLGVLTLTRATPYSYGDDDVAWAEDLGYRIALSVENGQLFAETRELFEQTVSANFVTSVDGRILACNQTFATLLGFSSVHEAVGSSVAGTYSDPGERQRILERLRTSERIVAYDLVLRRRDGSAIHVRASAHGVLDGNGALVRIAGYLTDRSREHAVEEQARRIQRLDAVGRLAAGIAHDFNNLLTVIVSSIDLLREGESLADGHRPLDELERASRRATALTRQLLSFGRRQMLAPRDVNLPDLLRALQPAVRRTAPSNVVLVFDLNPDTPATHMDPDHLEHAVISLVENAVEAMQGGGTLTLSTSAVSLTADDVARYPYVVPGDYVSLKVQDTGVGMDEAVQARAFEPFFSTREVGKGGAGLGLSSVYGIVKQSGGYIWLASEPGTGTTVRICLPVAPARQPTAVAAGQLSA